MPRCFSVIHRNLKFILLCQSAAYTMRFLVKLCISEPIRLLGPNIVWHESANPVSLVLFFSNISFRSMLGHVIVLERTMATLWARNYERREARLFSCCWFSAVVGQMMIFDDLFCMYLLPFPADCCALQRHLPAADHPRQRHPGHLCHHVQLVRGVAALLCRNWGQQT
jgi:hypothetical protein